MARRFSRPGTSTRPIDEAYAILTYARKLVGEEGDPCDVSNALFKAAFTSLVRLPEEDDRRLRLVSRVHERAYEI